MLGLGYSWSQEFANMKRHLLRSLWFTPWGYERIVCAKCRTHPMIRKGTFKEGTKCPTCDTMYFGPSYTRLCIEYSRDSYLAPAISLVFLFLLCAVASVAGVWVK